MREKTAIDYATPQKPRTQTIVERLGSTCIVATCTLFAGAFAIVASLTALFYFRAIRGYSLDYGLNIAQGCNSVGLIFAIAAIFLRKPLAASLFLILHLLGIILSIALEVA